MCVEPFYDSVLDDDDEDSGASSGLKRLGVSLGLKLRPWEGPGVRSARSEVSLIDFTDDSFSSATPSPLTETHPLDQDTLHVRKVGWSSVVRAFGYRSRGYWFKSPAALYNALFSGVC